MSLADLDPEMFLKNGPIGEEGRQILLACHGIRYPPMFVVPSTHTRRRIIYKACFCGTLPDPELVFGGEGCSGWVGAYMPVEISDLEFLHTMVAIDRDDSNWWHYFTDDETEVRDNYEKLRSKGEVP